MKQRIDDLVNALSDSASQKISKIKKAFENAIGEDLAKNYYIKGGNGEVKRIILDRSMVDLTQLN
jgi:predicted nuclease with TOPRIM domain